MGEAPPQRVKVLACERAPQRPLAFRHGAGSCQLPVNQLVGAHTSVRQGLASKERWRRNDMANVARMRVKRCMV